MLGGLSKHGSLMDCGRLLRGWWKLGWCATVCITTMTQTTYHMFSQWWRAMLLWPLGYNSTSCPLTPLPYHPDMNHFLCCSRNTFTHISLLFCVSSQMGVHQSTSFSILALPRLWRIFVSLARCLPPQGFSSPSKVSLLRVESA